MMPVYPLKWHKVIALTATLLLGGTACAQGNIVKVNALSPLARSVSLGYERILAKKSSVQFGYFDTGYRAARVRYRGWGITAAYRFYLSDKTRTLKTDNTNDEQEPQKPPRDLNAPEGWYAGPFFRYQDVHLVKDSVDSRASLAPLTGGLLLGRQWAAGKHFTLDAFIGPSFSSGTLDVEKGSESDFGIKGIFYEFGVLAGVAVGFRF